MSKFLILARVQCDYLYFPTKSIYEEIKILVNRIW